jgi:hypothetical protein
LRTRPKNGTLSVFGAGSKTVRFWGTVTQFCTCSHSSRITSFVRITDTWEWRRC